MPGIAPVTEFPDFGLTPEQRRVAVLGHYYEYPGMDGERGEIWCYTDRFAYRAGETRDAACQLDRQPRSASRSCATARTRNAGPERSTSLAARWQETPDQCSVEGCGWDASLRVRHRRRVAVRRLPRHADGRGPRRQADPLRSSHHRRRRRRPKARPHPAGRGDRHLDRLQHLGRLEPLSGHHRAEAQPVRHHGQHRAAAGAAASCVLPPDAPRVPLEISLPPLTAPRYPHMEWAYATGHSKKYASSGWASYDSHFFRWAERAGYARRSRQPARAAFRARAPRRLRLRRLRRP